MDPTKSLSPIRKQGLLRTSEAAVGAFPLSLDEGTEGAGVGNSTVSEAAADGGESMEGATFNFFFTRFSSGFERVGFLCDRLLRISILSDINATALLCLVIGPGGEGSTTR